MITSDKMTEIMQRPIYRLSGYAYKKGKTPSADDVSGVNCDFILAESDFCDSGNSIRCDGGDAFPWGNAVAKTCTLSIKSSVMVKAADFAGGYVMLTIKAYPLSGESWTVTGDRWFVSAVAEKDGKISLECVDAISKLDKAYTYSADAFTLGTSTYLDLLNHALVQCGLPSAVASTVPDSSGYVPLSNRLLASKLEDESLQRLANSSRTCRQICEYVAFAVLGNVTASGGGYVNVNSLLYADTGLSLRGHELTKWHDIDVSAEDINLSGIEYIRQTDAKGNKIEPVTYRSGDFSYDYALSVVDNPLIIGSADEISAVLQLFKDLIDDVPIRNFEGKHIAYPLVEYGDFAKIRHLGGNFETLVTGYDWDITGTATIMSAVKGSAENGSTYSSGSSSSSSVVTNQDALNSITSEKVSSWDAAAGTAYVTVKSTENGWECREWSNGDAECWYNYDINALSCTTAVGGWYRTAEIKPPAYPFAFAGDPSVNMFFETGSGTGALIWPAGTLAEIDVKIQPHQVYLIRMTSSPGISGKLHIMAHGRKAGAN